MSEPAGVVLVIDDSKGISEAILQAASPRYEVHFAGTIQDAYWKFVENPELYKLVLLDFNLEGNRAKSNFDGIDLALMIDTFARWRGLPTPWLVALTAAPEELLDCFFNLSTDAPLMDVIRKRGETIHEQLGALFSALAAQDPKQFQTPYAKSGRRIKQDIEYDKESLRKLCQTYRERGEEYFKRVAGNISKRLFQSYRKLRFSALAPGFSGSEVLSVVAERTTYSLARTFVIKLCKDKTEASRKLSDEVKNYFNYATRIKEHVPLLIGPFEIKGWNFIAYDFVSVEGKGVSTFADYLNTALQDPRYNKYPDIFKQNFSLAHSAFIFETILKKWHASSKVAGASPDTRFFYFKDENWFEPHLEEAKNKIIAVYDELRPALQKSDKFLNMDLGLGPEVLMLANPLVVVNNLLSEGAYKHQLSGGMVHGDLHSGNILRSLNMHTETPGEWMLIDFANVIGAAHLAQDGSRLECDIKFQRIVSSLKPRFTLEIELARWLDQFLAVKLDTLLDMPYWAQEWNNLANNYKLVQYQIQAIRENTLKRLEEGASRELSVKYLDYTVALLMQSLMFVRYSRNPIRTLHAWLAACLAATLVEQYFEAVKGKAHSRDVFGGELLGFD